MARAELVEIPRARHTVQGDNPADFAARAGRVSAAHAAGNGG